MENPFRYFGRPLQDLILPNEGKRQLEAAQKARDENRRKTERLFKRLDLYPPTGRDNIEDDVFCLLQAAVEEVYFNKQTERKKSPLERETVTQLSVFYSKTAAGRVQTILDNEEREAGIIQQVHLWIEFKTRAQELVRIGETFYPPKHRIASIQEHLKSVMSDFINHSRKTTKARTS